MKLLIDVTIDPHFHHPVDVARSGTEGQPIEDMDGIALRRGFSGRSSGHGENQTTDRARHLENFSSHAGSSCFCTISCFCLFVSGTVHASASLLIALAATKRTSISTGVRARCMTSRMTAS